MSEREILEKVVELLGTGQPVARAAGLNEIETIWTYKTHAIVEQAFPSPSIRLSAIKLCVERMGIWWQPEQLVTSNDAQ